MGRPDGWRIMKEGPPGARGPGGLVPDYEGTSALFARAIRTQLHRWNVDHDRLTRRAASLCDRLALRSDSLGKRAARSRLTALRYRGAVLDLLPEIEHHARFCRRADGSETGDQGKTGEDATQHCACQISLGKHLVHPQWNRVYLVPYC